MHKNAVFLLISVIAVIPIPLVLPVNSTALPSPIIIAASIVGLVSIFGVVFSILMRKRERKRAR